VLRRNYSKTELLKDCINGYWNVSEWKLEFTQLGIVYILNSYTQDIREADAIAYYTPNTTGYHNNTSVIKWYYMF
jgi:hypothetical protein